MRGFEGKLDLYDRRTTAYNEPMPERELPPKMVVALAKLEHILDTLNRHALA